MRMPFTEFIASGDLKFIIAFFIFSGIAIYSFFKKLQAKKSEEKILLTKQYNTKINNAASWILILSVLSLLLGLMHSFYFIGKAGGIAPGLIFQGFAYALITPVFGFGLFIFCKILSGILNLKPAKS